MHVYLPTFRQSRLIYLSLRSLVFTAAEAVLFVKQKLNTIQLAQ